MPRSVIVVSSDLNLFESARAVLRADDRFTDAGDYLHCDGSVAPLTNIYPVEMTSADWEGWEPGGSDMPDPKSMSAVVFECRSPEWVAEVGSLLAQGLEMPVWFVDSADCAWPADRVDPDRIALAG
jgi:hypothetical protein